MADYRLVPGQRQEGSRGFPDYNLTPHPGTAYIYYKLQISSTQFQIMGNNRISKAWEIENLARFSRFEKAFPEISPVLSFDLEALRP